jgi:hypothetical protein
MENYQKQARPLQLEAFYLSKQIYKNGETFTTRLARGKPGN